ncbi:MAG: hypothetical protein WCC91_25785, partial [Bradyrhizobium sp.]
NGRSIEAGKNYKVASWASVNEQRGTPVWDVFASYLGSGKPLGARGVGVTLRGVDGNPGITAPDEAFPAMQKAEGRALLCPVDRSYARRVGVIISGINARTRSL